MAGQPGRRKASVIQSRTDNEDVSMQEDRAEEEEKSEETNTNITLEDTERLLKQVGTQYAKDNAQRVHEERITDQAKVETLLARYD